MNKIDKANEYKEQIKQLTEIDVMQNSRKNIIVEHRSLFVYLLRSVEKWKYKEITAYFRENKKPYDHTTALYAYNNFKFYCKYNKNLEILFYKLLDKNPKQKHDIINELIKDFSYEQLCEIISKIQLKESINNIKDESTDKQNKRKPIESTNN
tara:strand:+ start:1818 stop:2276 length:459 start_codon:yes stop_codon:yes gene_type:complete